MENINNRVDEPSGSRCYKEGVRKKFDCYCKRFIRNAAYDVARTPLFVNMTMKVKTNSPRKFIRYKDGAQMYGMSLSSFKELAKNSGALYHPSEKVALINTEKLDEYLEYFRG